AGRSSPRGTPPPSSGKHLRLESPKPCCLAPGLEIRQAVDNPVGRGLGSRLPVLKKLLIALVAGAVLAPVGLALSSTSGTGAIQTSCARYAQPYAAGGVYVKKCIVVVKRTVTRTKTVYYPVTVTRTNVHTNTYTRR